MTQPRWSPELARVNVHEDYTLLYWSERFDVPKDEIQAAAKKVGTRVEDVARELSRYGFCYLLVSDTARGILPSDPISLHESRVISNFEVIARLP
jgi:hypothetical protein